LKSVKVLLNINFEDVRDGELERDVDFLGKYWIGVKTKNVVVVEVKDVEEAQKPIV
jgi:hypothetical protein